MRKLFDYQKKIVDSQQNSSSALFMEPGTGKTLTSLALFEKSKKQKILVICIVSKLEDWASDLWQECDTFVKILDKGSKKNSEIIKNNETSENPSSGFVISFESSWRCVELLKWVDNDTYVIVDESHKIKSVKSSVGKFMQKLKNRTKTKCILTGTPQSRGYIDYYNQLLFTDILNIPFKIFNDTYCVYDTQQYNGFPFKRLTGYKNTKELDELINEKCVFFKRDISNEQIPAEIDIKFNKPNKYEYFKKVRLYEDYVADNASKLFVTLRKMCSGNIDIYKTDNQKIQWLEDFCETLNFRLVIFYNFNFEKHDMIALFNKLKIPISLYCGDTKDLSNFDKYETSVVLCQYQSASLGLNNLVKSNVCIMYSPSINYTDYIQAKKRIDRIGQTKKPLFYNLFCKNTVEEKILTSIKQGKDFDEKMFIEYMKEK